MAKSSDRLGIEKGSAKMTTGSGQGMSSRINVAVGSGSRPTASKFKTPSSAPADPQMIRPSQKIGS